jgi:hypothetical protein
LTIARIITVQGETRDVVIIGERLRDDDTGEVIGTQGFYIDVTPTNEERQASISQALSEIAETRASIEQAKGVLMYIYGIGPTPRSTCCGGDPRKPTSNCVRSPSKCWPTSSHSSTTRRSPITPDIRRAVPHSPRTRGSQKHLNVKLRALAQQLMTIHERITQGPNQFHFEHWRNQAPRPCKTDC